MKGPADAGRAAARRPACDGLSSAAAFAATAARTDRGAASAASAPRPARRPAEAVSAAATVPVPEPSGLTMSMLLMGRTVLAAVPTETGTTSELRGACAARPTPGTRAPMATRPHATPQRPPARHTSPAEAGTTPNATPTRPRTVTTMLPRSRTTTPSPGPPGLWCGTTRIGRHPYRIDRQRPDWSLKLAQLAVRTDEMVFLTTNRWHATELANHDALSVSALANVALPYGQFDQLTITAAPSEQAAWWDLRFETSDHQGRTERTVSVFAANHPYQRIYQRALRETVSGWATSHDLATISGLCASLPAAALELLARHPDTLTVDTLQPVCDAVRTMDAAALELLTANSTAGTLGQVLSRTLSIHAHLTRRAYRLNAAELELLASLTGDWDGTSEELADTVIATLT